MKKRRVLKKGLDNFLHLVNVISIFGIMITINTLEKPFKEIKLYLLILVIDIIVVIINTLIIKRYSRYY